MRSHQNTQHNKRGENFFHSSSHKKRDKGKYKHIKIILMDFPALIIFQYNTISNWILYVRKFMLVLPFDLRMDRDLEAVLSWNGCLDRKSIEDRFLDQKLIFLINFKEGNRSLGKKINFWLQDQPQNLIFKNLIPK